MTKRDIFGKLSEGFDALRAQREGKLTLRTHKLEVRAAPTITAQQVVSTPEGNHEPDAHAHPRRPLPR